MFKKVLKFIIFLLPWFLSSLICRDYSFFNDLNIPTFSLPQNLFGIAWFIIYCLISISVVFSTENNTSINYKKDLLYNYIFNQLYAIIFFCFRNIFFGFIMCLLTLLTALFLYYETKSINKKASYFLIPYVLFLVYATILSTTIYFMNS